MPALPASASPRAILGGEISDPELVKVRVFRMPWGLLGRPVALVGVLPIAAMCALAASGPDLAALFLFVSYVGVFLVFLGIARSSTHVDHDGVEFVGALRRTRVPWSDIEWFEIEGAQIQRVSARLIGGKDKACRGLSTQTSNTRHNNPETLGRTCTFLNRRLMLERNQRAAE